MEEEARYASVNSYLVSVIESKELATPSSSYGEQGPKQTPNGPSPTGIKAMKRCRVEAVKKAKDGANAQRPTPNTQ